MTLQVYAVFDEKVRCFGSPIFCRTRGEAVRGFTSAVMQKDSDFHRFAEDYSLFALAHYEQESGLITPLEAPEMVVSAFVIKAQLKEGN